MIILPEQVVCGYCDCSEFGALTVSPQRRITGFEIELYLEDGFSRFLDGREYKIQKNYIQIAKPGQTGSSILPFSTVYIKFHAAGELADRLTRAPEYFRSSHPGQIRNLMDEIILLTEEDNRRELLLQSKVLALLDLILSDSKLSDVELGTDYQIITKAKRFIEQHAGERIRLSDIAASVNLSKIYFHNNFTAAVGITPHRYLTECRIETVKKLLWSRELPVSEIAEKSGFCNQQHLNKVFKAETGMTPLEYRKAFQKKYMD